MTTHPLYDLADLYEAAFDFDAALEAAFYAQVLGEGRILDVGCGTGRVLAALVAAGEEAVGLERNTAMAARARAKGLDVTVGDMREFHLGRACDGAFSHLSTFRYLLEDEEVHSHLDAMAAALPRPCSRYAIDHDLVGPDFDPHHPGQTWTRGGAEATWRALGAPRGGRLREECVLRAGPREVRHVEDLRAWTLDEVTSAIETHGAFEIEAWWAPPFEIAAPFRPVPWTPRAETRRVVTVLRRR
jgi:SAM-dependent methyltransferase